MGRKTGGQIDDLTMRLIARSEALRADRGWSYTLLACKMGMTRSNLTRYLHPEESGYGSWTQGFNIKIAAAFGMTYHQFLGDLLDTHAAAALTVAQQAIGVWDPSSAKVIEAIKRFTEHETLAADGIGFFRIPPGPVTLPNLSHCIYQNLFSHLDTVGERIINSYAEMTRAYTEEYERCGGHYDKWENTTLLFEGEICRLIRGEGEYRGCEAWASAWLDDLKNRHVKKLGYRLGFIDETKIPPEIYYNLMNADSLIIIGRTLSVRRVIGTLGLEFLTGGEQFERDQSHMRELARGYADFSQAGVIRKLESFERNVKGPRRTTSLT